MPAPTTTRPDDEGMDILKFFIAIMGFLTVLVAGMALYNWMSLTELEAEVASQEERLEQMRKIGEGQGLRDMIAQERAQKDLVDVLQKDLGQHLTDVAKNMGITLEGFRRSGREGASAQGFDKISYDFTLNKLTLDSVTEYLFYLQASWPGLKIEDITIKEPAGWKKTDPFPGWSTSVKVSIFRPKAKES